MTHELRFAPVVLFAVALGCSSDEGAGPAGPGAAGSGGVATAGAGGGAAGSFAMAGAAGSSAPAAGNGGSSPSAGTGGSGGLTSGGMSGAAGASGAAGSVGAGGGNGKSPPTPSPGCGMAAGQALGSWVEQPKLRVNNKDRQWWVWLPAGYDPQRAYPVVFTLHGCGGPDNFIPIQEATGSDAIVVRGTGADNGCWTYGGEGDDVKFFDAMLDGLEVKRCVDTSRVFSMGYSSGGWMTNTLECTRGDKLRATGLLSGGRAGLDLATCKGKFARATVHDLADPTNPFDKQGAKEELDRVLKQNHCRTDVPPLMEEPAPCARYQGCDAGFPVIACRTEGQKHNRQDALAKKAFWGLFSSL